MNTPLDELPLPKYKKQTDILKKQKDERIVSDYLDQILSKQWITDYFRQCAFYSFAFEEMYGILPEQFVIIIAVQDYGNQLFTGKPEDWRDDKFFVERFNVS